jgi:hypothetical protein
VLVVVLEVAMLKLQVKQVAQAVAHQEAVLIHLVLVVLVIHLAPHPFKVMQVAGHLETQITGLMHIVQQLAVAEREQQVQMLVQAQEQVVQVVTVAAEHLHLLLELQLSMLAVAEYRVMLLLVQAAQVVAQMEFLLIMALEQEMAQ